MVEDDWLPITGTGSDPLIGDSEIISIHFRPEGGGLLLELQNLFPDGARVSQMRFFGVRLFQLRNEGIHYLDRVDVFERVSDALHIEPIATSIGEGRVVAPISIWPVTYGEGLRLYRFMPIAGDESFVICKEAFMRPWRPKPE
jgi:hypothetical protein